MPTEITAIARDTGATLRCALKVVSGAGLSTLRAWLIGHDALIVSSANQDPLVVIPLQAWRRLAHMDAPAPNQRPADSAGFSSLLGHPRRKQR